WEVHHVRSKKAAQMRKNSAPDKQHTRGHVLYVTLPLPRHSLTTFGRWGYGERWITLVVVMQIRFFLHWSYQE
ncbi:hypothetical protein, partial [Escherichia coli]|uniref:hypothetical protein n=1 Tax=Escherichia coli TaxID=562 RepID=UPI00388E5074